MKRREFIAGLGGAAAWPVVAGAQAERVRRVGVLFSGKNETRTQREMAIFAQVLAKSGWMDGRNIGIAYRWGDGDANRIRVNVSETFARGP
jgi:putative tryptophan/tyrosine transport system substrate-binding protein